MSIKIGVHNSVFHSDELIAIALIRIATGDDIEVVRSRDELVLGECEILVDVGGVYDALKQKYDHHQFNETSKYYGLSSAGLVLKDVIDSLTHFYDGIEDIVQLVKAVDARDTRVGYDVSNVYEPLFDAISHCNTVDPMSKSQDDRFIEVLDKVEDIILTLLTKDIDAYTKQLEAFETLAESYDKDNELVFEMREAFTEDVDEVVVAKFFPNWRAISRDTGKCFIMPGDKTSQYKIMTDTSKYQIATTKDEVFTHFNGFISVVEPKEDSTIIGIILTNGKLLEVDLKRVREAFNHIEVLTD